MCLIPLFFINVSNSALVNCVPLSVTNAFGNLCVTNIECKCSIVAVDVAAVRALTSSHFE